MKTLQSLVKSSDRLKADDLSSEEIYQAAKELTELYNLLSKVNLGDIEEYLEYMAKKDKNYKAVETSFKKFIPAYQKFYNDLRKVRD